MKSAVLMGNVLATKPDTSMLDCGPNNIPLGLVMNTCPLACMRPMICDGLGSSTRFRVIEDALG